MCKGAEAQAEAFEKLEAKLRHSHAQQGPGACCSWRPWADVGNRALRNYLGCFTLCLTAGARGFLVTGALGRRKRPLKCSKSSQYNSLGRASLFFVWVVFWFFFYFAVLVLQHTYTHEESFSSYALQKAKPPLPR